MTVQESGPPVTAPGSLSQDVIDAMRAWLLANSVYPYSTAWGFNAPQEWVAKEIARFYPGGVSAFIRDHRGDE